MMYILWKFVLAATLLHVQKIAANDHYILKSWNGHAVVGGAAKFWQMLGW